MTLRIVSFGGGVNSTALILGKYERQEPIDVVLFADTGGEKPETYKHLDLMDEWLTTHGLPVCQRVRESESLEDDCLRRSSLPGKAFGFGSCSEHFKIRPQKRWLAGREAHWFVGIHYGEKHRAERILNQREDVSFPLIEWRWQQQECEDAILRHGLPVPVKSACFFCPASKKREVLQLSKDHPELFERAVEMERCAKDAGSLDVVKGLGRYWSWEHLVKSDDEQLRLFGDDQAPICDACIDW